MSLSFRDVEKIKAADKLVRAERNRLWRARNPEKSRESSKRWREANKGAHRVSNRLWRVCNRDKARASQRAWLARHPNYHKEWRQRMRAAGHYRKGGKYYYPRKEPV